VVAARGPVGQAHEVPERCSALQDEVLAVLASMEGLAYLGEPVSQLIHALEAGAALRTTGADDELVLAGVLHDVGRTLAARRPGQPHEVAGARWCAERFGERVAYLVGAHVAAKRVLVATDPGYSALLSPTSVATLEAQGGPADQDEVAAFSTGRWPDDALALRRADEAAKDPDGRRLSLAEVVELVERVAGAGTPR